MNRGGKREGAGRPTGTKKDNTTKPRKIRLTDEEYSNYLELGGARWLRPILRQKKKASFKPSFRIIRLCLCIQDPSLFRGSFGKYSFYL